MKFILNTALCQSPVNASKNKKAINFIKQAMFYRCTQIDIPNDGIHHITIIFTNNNLAETVQWRSRLGKDIKNLNVRVLSSNKKKDTFNNIANIIQSIICCKKLDDLLDILVMCSHSKRIDDVINLIDACCNLSNRIYPQKVFIIFILQSCMMKLIKILILFCHFWRTKKL